MDASGTTRGIERGSDGARRYQPLLTVLAAVAAGVVLDRQVKPAGFLTLFSFAAIFLLLWWLARCRRRDASAALILLASALLAGAAWHHLRWQLFSQYEIARYGEFELAPACIEAVARQAPERLPAPQPTPLRAIPGNERSRLVVELVGIRDAQKWRPAAGLCQLLVEGHLLGVRPGDRLRVFGQLARPQPPLNPGEFDFAAHARADRQLARLRSSSPDSVLIVRRSPAWQPPSVLATVRTAGKDMVRRYIGPERAALASAILLGAREGLPHEETTSYRVTGTIHLLVVSGLHVGILVVGLYWLMQLGWFSRRASLAAIIAVVVAYALLAEARPPVVRAGVLAVLVCVAAWAGRSAVAFNSLAAAGLFVLAVNPAELFRTGTQLSFLAVAALISNHAWSPFRRTQQDPLDRLIEETRPWHQRMSRNAVSWTVRLWAMTFFIWLTALPLVLFQFHVVTPVALLIAPAVWALVFSALWFGFSTLLIGWLVPQVAGMLGAVCDWSLGALEWVVQQAEAAPGSHFWSAGPAGWWVAVFYVGLVAVMIGGRALAAPRWQLAALSLWIIAGLVPALSRPWMRGDAVECSFVAVGHGACIVLETPTGETLLYDAGAIGSPEYATQTIAAYLWHRGIRRIDGIVISHADIDHYNAVPGLLQRFPVGAIYVSPMMFDRIGESGSSGPEMLRTEIERAGVPLREIWSGHALRIGEHVTAHVLHPPRVGVIGTDNANSITLAVECHGWRVLLPGDLESPGLEDVMAELPYDCDVLLAPHHGSRLSDPPGFAAWSTPEWVVISGAAQRDVGPVVETYQQAGAEVVRTSHQGAVRFSFRRGETALATWVGRSDHQVTNEQ